MHFDELESEARSQEESELGSLAEFFVESPEFPPSTAPGPVPDLIFLGSSAGNRMQPLSPVSGGVSGGQPGNTSGSGGGSVQATRWVFTLNNPTPVEETNIKKSVEGDYRIRYLIFGHELAPTTGTPHLQGYVEFSKKCTRYRIKTVPG